MRVSIRLRRDCFIRPWALSISSSGVPGGMQLSLAMSMKVMTTLTTSHLMRMCANIVYDCHVPKSMVGCAIIRTLYAESTYLHGGVQ